MFRHVAITLGTLGIQQFASIAPLCACTRDLLVGIGGVVGGLRCVGYLGPLRVATGISVSMPQSVKQGGGDSSGTVSGSGSRGASCVRSIHGRGVGDRVLLVSLGSGIGT